MSGRIIVEVAGGAVVNVYGAEDYVVVDWDTVEECGEDALPTLPAGYAYNDDRDAIVPA